MGQEMADSKGERLKLGFNSSLKLEFHGAKVTSDAGLLAYRGLDKALGLFDRVPSVVQDLRTGRNIQHDLPALLRPGNVHSADGWKELLEPIVTCYEKKTVRKYFRGDAAFAKPEIL